MCLSTLVVIIHVAVGVKCLRIVAWTVNLVYGISMLWDPRIIVSVLLEIHVNTSGSNAGGSTAYKDERVVRILGAHVSRANMGW
jgi:hypothetical protein